MTGTLSSLNVATLVPLLTLVGTAVGILLFDLWGVPWRLSAWVSLTSLVIAAVLTLIVVVSGQGGTVQGMLSGDGIAAPLALFFCGVGGATVLIGLGSADTQDGGRYALVLFAISGALIVAQSTHVLPLAIGLAILHVTSSALIGPRAAWRYLITLGAGLACTLLGTSLTYGAAGSLRIDLLVERLSRQATIGATNSLAMVGLGLIIGGLTLMLGVVPFHTWLSATYRKAQTLGGVLISLALPGAAIAALSRLGDAWAGRGTVLLAALGSLSIILGYWIALRSCRVREVLTGIVTAQSGTILLTLAAPTAGWTALPLEGYILASNGLSLACLWAMAVSARREDRNLLTLDDLAGLGHQRPWLAGAVTLCLLNLAGMPLLAGSVVQLHLFRAVAVGGYGWAVGLAVVGTSMAGLLAGRWMFTMWMCPPQDRTWIPTPPEVAVVALAAAGGVLLAGIYAETILNWIASLVASS